MSQVPDSRTSLTLLERLRQDPADPRAWDEFVRRYRPKIVGWCGERGLQGADAEDVAQMVLTKLLDTMRHFRYDPSGSFRAWLKTITLRACHDLTSKQRPGTEPLDDRVQLALSGPGAGDELAHRIDMEFDRELLDLAIARVQARVVPATWEAFRLTAFEGCKGAEAARRLGIPVAHVFVAKHRVQKMLQQEVKDLERGDRAE